ncbi:virulence factor Mce [Williamsia sp. 1138]|uniref:MCE family protein n=1 Tax=Gordonia rubripertincta TaxID=36822 RepID=A0ABT4MY92_GORRU|nr:MULTISPECIES: MCE family protein [Mycobacteriales]MCZ4551989.1 MCE family protein [Gordonia rubripertincta]OZG28116.1 virulence factor Mce [Williamsia sp. 1138]
MAQTIERPSWAKKLAATFMVVSLVAVCALAALQFLGSFQSTVPVTLTADRAGLVMNPDAKVRLRGVVVGRVGDISESADGVTLKLDMNPDQLKYIPANVRADIKSNTVFGAKSVNLEIPDDPSKARLSGGSTIETEDVVVELNTIYQRLVDVLAEVQPEKLNATIGAIDTALSGRGEQIGQGFADLSDLLRKTNPHLDALSRDIEAGAEFTNVYADVMPDLLKVVDNFTFTGNTLVDNASDLDALLMNVTGMADTINGVIAPSKADIISTLANLNPTARLLGYQSPGLACFIESTAAAGQKALPVFGIETGYVALNAGLLPGKEPYRYPEDLPRVNVDGPPTCQDGLSDPDSAVHTDFYVGDNAAYPYQPRTTPKADPTKLFQVMFGPAPRG